MDRIAKEAEAKGINGLLIKQTKKTDRNAVLGYMVARNHMEFIRWRNFNRDWDITGEVVADFSA